MTVTDINGCVQEVTDLNDAIKQARFFKDCHHEPPTPYGEKMLVYWNDLYVKLLALKNSSSK